MCELFQLILVIINNGKYMWFDQELISEIFYGTFGTFFKMLLAPKNWPDFAIALFIEKLGWEVW